MEGMHMAKQQIINGTTGDWEVVIGLEIHAQVTSESKLFSRSSTKFGAEPNSQVSFIDAAMPGSLPIFNEKCVEQAVKTGLGIGAKINKYSVFDRKHYFYPDLPQGYQISQFTHPIVEHGSVVIDLPDGSRKTVKIERIHLEQDAGKSLHDQSPSETFIDLNRAGIALMEIVTAPDIRSSEEAAEFLKKMRSIVRYLGTCDGDMEKGSMRCDANVSVRRVNAQELGTRVEIKNINSVRFLAKAIDFEAERQVESLENNRRIVQETRLFDNATGQTRAMRSKEDAIDYRYFPDPNLLPLEITDEYIEKIRHNLPELPDQKIERYGKLGVPHYDASVLVGEKAVAAYFEKVMQLADPKLAASWITAELFGRLNKAGLDIENCPIPVENFSTLLHLLQKSTISGKIAKQVLDYMFETGDDPESIIQKHNLIQITDLSAIESIIDQMLSENAQKVAEYKSGKDKLFGFFVGKVMQLTQGTANPNSVNDLLKKKLGA